MSSTLALYLVLERTMLAYEEHDEELADSLRDTMDPLWYAMTDAERAALDQRVMVFEEGRGIHLPLAPMARKTATAAPEPPFLSPPRSTPLEVTGWRLVA